MDCCGITEPDSGADAGQPCDSSVQACPMQRGDLVVTLINEEDNTKISGAAVRLQGPQDVTQSSDPSGHANFTQIQAGSYNISHTSSCFTPVNGGATVRGATTSTAELRLRHIHAVVIIKELSFTGNNVVEKDTLGNFPSPEWKEGRASADQSPVAYARNKKVNLNAKFKVTTRPCQPELVEVKGSASFGPTSLEWTGSKTVNPGDSEVTYTLSSNNPLANEVGIFESSDISWQMRPPGQGWVAAGTTHNVLYVTLGNPSGTPNYWTLLEISCKASSSAKDESELASKMFTPFISRSVMRKRDNHQLTYWNPVTTTVTNTRELLADSDGSGQCGAWAEFLKDMFMVHGVTSADKVEIIRNQADRNRIGFLVKKWAFKHPPPSSAAAFTHLFPSELNAKPIPGQSNASPPPAFFNHFIVRFGSKFYDPSYGAGPFTAQVSWELAAIDGLFRKTPAPEMAGFDKSLPAIANTTILEFWDLTTNTKIP
jgi:hypothetical protein